MISEQSMVIVTPEDGLNPPGCCVFTADVSGPFLDTRRWIPYADPYGLVHVPFVKEMGRAVGMVEREEVEELREALAAVESELEQLRKIAEKVSAVESLEQELEKMT